ncbi:glycosyltransferase family 2 protein [uncultured Clostridium sp.]|uniref:glycosyltransferase family A protein n=1 Tax=uncultured Clostridium sp. TaxID=59620 RepID=UPI0028E2E0FA|nr:glycosyltransferase family 2 protein [uncultured Clostridium sp.]
MYTISIIVRTSTRYIFLDRAIKDIMNQTYNKWKIILVNDKGDLNKIHNIIDNNQVASDKYTIINNEGQSGLHKAINLGTRAVETKYVVMHDDDDTWDNNFLEKTVGYLEYKKSCMGVITHSNKVYEKVVNDEIKVKKVKPFNTDLKDVISLYDMIKNNLFSPISFVYRTKVYKEIGYFDEDLEVLEDWEFNIRFLIKYDIEVIEEILANYHIRKNNNINEAFKNTVTSKRKLHLKYDTIIRNRYLRDDLNNQGFGIGTLMNILKWSDNRIMKKIKRYIHK